MQKTCSERHDNHTSVLFKSSDTSALGHFRDGQCAHSCHGSPQQMLFLLLREAVE